MTPLGSFVREHLGDVQVVRRPVRRGMTRVLHVRDSRGQEWFGKRLLVRERWAAEHRAYRHWSGVRGVAPLRAADEARGCLLLPRLPGTQPSGDDRRALLGAGRLLGRLHGRTTAAGWSTSWREASTMQVERLLTDLPDHGVHVDEGLVRACQTALLALDLPEVSTHGDYQPHNWLQQGRRTSVVDLESADLRPAAFDLARLRYAACWHDRPRFWTFLAGYGRVPTADERTFVVASLAWRALNAIDLGLRTGRREMVTHGLDVLDALAAGRVSAV